MDINVKVRLESPELMAAILALAEALPQIKLGAVLPIKEEQTVEPNTEVIKTESKNEEPLKQEFKKEESKTVALEDVRAKLAALSQAGKQKEVKALIKKFGANKLTEVAEEHYVALLKEAEAI
jgi:N-methylhydantoinase B/oxoprolinase/acetone carboxylase alpha subunit